MLKQYNMTEVEHMHTNRVNTKIRNRWYHP